MTIGNQSKKIIIGITGSFGSGKTTVARIFKSYGAKVIDADEIARRVARRGTAVYKKILESFGKGVFKENGELNRPCLAGLVFNNKRLLKKLNGITHPEIIRVIKKEIRGCRTKIIVLDAPLLLEAGLRKLVDKLIVVVLSEVRQIQRIKKKTSLKKQGILLRIYSQIPLKIKVRLADFIIDNNGTINETKKQAEQIRRLVWKN